MTELALRQGVTLAEKITYAEALACAGLLPAQYREKPANVLFAMEYAEALGLPTISAITSVHVIDGKPSASADLIAMLVRRAGHKLRVSGDSAKATAVIIRADDPDFPFESVWDEEKASQAGLWGKGNWAKYPAAMLRARAITEVARSAASEALFGVIYTPEELGAEVDEEGVPIITTAGPRPHQAQARPLHVVADQGHATPAAPAETEEQRLAREQADADWLERVDGCDSVEDARALYAEAKDAGQLTRPVARGEETRQLYEWINARGAELAKITAEGKTAPAAGPVDAAEAREHGLTGDQLDGEATANATEAQEPLEGEVLDGPAQARPAPVEDPADLCRDTAQRKAVIRELTTLYGGAEAAQAAVEDEFGVPIAKVSTKRLRELMQREQQAAG